MRKTPTLTDRRRDREIVALNERMFALEHAHRLLLYAVQAEVISRQPSLAPDWLAKICRENAETVMVRYVRPADRTACRKQFQSLFPVSRVAAPPAPE